MWGALSLRSFCYCCNFVVPNLVASDRVKFFFRFVHCILNGCCAQCSVYVVHRHSHCIYKKQPCRLHAGIHAADEHDLKHTQHDLKCVCEQDVHDVCCVHAACRQATCLSHFAIFPPHPFIQTAMEPFMMWIVHWQTCSLNVECTTQTLGVELDLC